MRRKSFALMLAAALLISALGIPSVAGANEAPTRILIYHATPEMTDWFAGFIEAFNSANSDIILEQEVQKDSATLQVKYAAGEDPDILCGNTLITQQYMDMGKYEDLSSQTQWLDRIDPALVDSVKDVKTNAQYRIPLCKNTAGFLYNTQIFDALGLEEALTWETFIDNLRAIKKAMPDVTPWYIMSGNYGHQSYYFVHALRQLEIGAFETQKAVALNDAAVLRFDEENSAVQQWAEKLLQVQSEGLIDSEDAITGNDATAYEAFATGKAGVILTGTWFIGGLVKQFPEVKDFMSLAPFPAFVEGSSPFVVAGPDSSIAISSNSQKKEQIYRVIDSLLQPENLKSFSESRGAPSAFNDVVSDWSVLADKAVDNWAKYPSVVNMILPNGFGQSEVNKLAQELLVGAYTPEEFKDEFTKRWNAAF